MCLTFAISLPHSREAPMWLGVTMPRSGVSSCRERAASPAASTVVSNERWVVVFGRVFHIMFVSGGLVPAVATAWAAHLHELLSVLQPGRTLAAVPMNF